MATALPARPGASLGNFLRLAGLLYGRATPKSCMTTLLFPPDLLAADMHERVHQRETIMSFADTILAQCMCRPG